MKPELILNYYFNDRQNLKAEPFAGGHINSTFKVAYKDRSFILQKINEKVFTKPEKVMENLVRASEILEKSTYPYKVLTPEKTLEGEHFVRENNSLWRLFPFFSDAFAPLKVGDSHMAKEAARGFGSFDFYLKDLEAKQLHVTIKDFFNFELRLNNFSNAVTNNRAGRKSLCLQEIKSIMADVAIITESAKFQKKIPLRPIHGDTKISNVMLNKSSGEPYAVIDLDTLMPGHILYDFGDMVRSFTNTTEEDSSDYENTFMNWEYMKALCEGFLSETGKNFSPHEWESLIPGSVVVTYVQAIRFLSDYLNGDPYYKTEHPDHNLIRAKNQIALYKSILKSRKRISKLIDEIRSNC